MNRGQTGSLVELEEPVLMDPKRKKERQSPGWPRTAGKRSAASPTSGGSKRDAVERVPTRARILVVDDHPIVCQGLADLLNRQSDVTCCGAVGNIAAARQGISSLRPDLVLLDLRLGCADGLETIKALKAQFEGLRILIISQFDETIYAERALRAGALGYVMKEQASEELLQAVRTVLAGQIYVSPSIGRMAVGRILEDKSPTAHSALSSLSDRELHVFNAIGAGRSTSQIAAELHLSVKTIETYREHLKYKLGFSTGAELVAQAKAAAAAQNQGEPSGGRQAR
jgi:DNA-binding NarL/FixJ family response regulator